MNMSQRSNENASNMRKIYQFKVPRDAAGEYSAGTRAISETSTVDQGGNESRRPTPSNVSSTGPSRLLCRGSGSLPKRRHLLPDGSGTARLIAFVIYQLRTITAPAIGLLCAATFSNTLSLSFLVNCYMECQCTG